ncbi:MULTISPECIES: TetR/AcrR family transcriptional regulator [Mycolicibacterium]|uniref:Transcriptional regulator n=1 Tax=Mycolicibacterium senegalense TaxID=1796 RepID=A0A378W2S8_9MYCO|nr:MULTISPECIES: TetR/AcrR family transcriptional regulator [Mycolicibacterium]MCV7337526.1 TetR/AcrR family transcriptional regulator [Mycolicibacterium senegalense]MDR7289033.1 AcrR family transcriptional regulator [Mycolicibacterium senegalense]QZA25915.1 TetR/AcrR family transcriptional regulator [Mycolicibacterium senegalense]CDP84717.1 TetR family transcriptional regulator [Mycolicibacterium farcinogenes]SUA27397.1 transcriptional regulator [Mycolicibacterium senegalense]
MSASSAGRLYGGVTGEERIAERRRKLVEAGMNLFGSGDSGIVRVKDVIADAGLTERYFYENFGDLDALFDEVLGLVMDKVERDVDAAVADASGDAFARVSVALRTVVDTLAEDPRMIRIIFVEALGKGGRAGSRRNEILTRAAANFVRWSGADAADFTTSPVEARMKAFALSGAASELLIAWAEGLLDISPAELADFLVGMYWRINLP